MQLNFRIAPLVAIVAFCFKKAGKALAVSGRFECDITGQRSAHLQRNVEHLELQRDHK